jgi:hypothetical protein
MREMEYEKPVASGNLRFERNGEATGLVEAWKFTKALDGYSFLRIDVDSNSPSNQKITLVHVLLNRQMNIERLKFRYFGTQFDVDGDVQFDRNLLTLNRLISDKDKRTKKRIVEEFPFDPDSVFIFPTITSLALITLAVPEDGQRAYVTLDKDVHFSSQSGIAQVNWGKKEDMEVSRQKVAVRPCSISWETGQARLWLDELNWPVRVSLPDDVLAADVAYWRYQPAPDPGDRLG